MDDMISRAAAIWVSDAADYRSLTVEDVRKVTDVVSRGLRNLPAVDAIPVEWLFDWRDRALKEGMNPELVEWIEYILQIWSREKEAR